jgi:hypothetical protein
MEKAWLIESEKYGIPIYFEGTASPTSRENWTSDSLEAIRFARKEDAERFKMTYFPYAKCEAREHQWGI